MWFSYSPFNGFQLHDNERVARMVTEMAIEDANADAIEGRPHGDGPCSITNICWGALVQRVIMTDDDEDCGSLRRTYSTDQFGAAGLHNAKVSCTQQEDGDLDVSFTIKVSSRDSHAFDRWPFCTHIIICHEVECELR